jgi:microcystin-dependent protein
MANYEATRYDWDGQYLTSIEGVNTGVIIPWGAASVPSGFLECNGQAVSQATYAALFAVIGTTYGNPGGGNFNVPDLTDRTVVNKSNTKSLAQTGGANTVTPTGNIGGSLGNTTLTSGEIPSHSHSGAFTSAGGGGPEGAERTLMSGFNSVNSSSTGGGGSHDHTLSGTFTGTASSVLQPYLVLIYIIKT